MSNHTYNLRRRQHAVKPVEDPPDPLNDEEDKQPHPSESALNKWTPTLLKLSIQFVGCYVLTDGYLLSRLQNIDRKKQNVTIVHTIGCTQRIKESLDMLQRATGIGAVSYNRNSPAFVKKHPDRKGFWQWRVTRRADLQWLLLKAGENETGILPYLSHKRAQAVEMIQAWIEIERHNTAMKGCRGCRKGTEHTARCDACQKEKTRFWKYAFAHNQRMSDMKRKEENWSAAHSSA
jgi:hypothetical protein